MDYIRSFAGHRPSAPCGRTSGLLDALQELSGLRDLDSVTRLVTRAARALTGAAGATFALREGELIHYIDEDAVSPLWKGRRVPAEACISGWSIRNHRHAIVPDIDLDPRIPADAYRSTFVTSLAIVPIREQDPIGAVGAYWAHPHTATAHELAELQTLANAAAVAIANVEQYGALLIATRAAEQAQVLGQAQAQRLQLALAAAQIGIWEHDVQTSVLHLDTRCLELFGFPPGATPSFQDTIDRVVPEDRPLMFAALERALEPAQGGDFDIEYRTVRDGLTRWVRSTGRALGGKHGPVHVMGTSQDISERRRVDEERARLLAREQAAREQAETASRVREQFLALLGHELRNPLAPIVMALENLKQRGEGGQREHAVIERQVKHMVRLIDDLLDVSRITQGRISLYCEPIDLAAVVDRAIEEAGPLLAARRHQLERRIAPALRVSGDFDRLVQVVANLLTNAAKYTPPAGHITLSVEGDAATVVLRVKDDGIGIAPTLLPRVFDLFVQAQQSSDRADGGLGLGLPLVRSIVALHGGSVEAHSAGCDRGSEFIVRLPRLQDLPVEPTAPAPAPAPAASASPGNILIVDDNLDAAEMLADLLATEGWVTRIANDGPSALMMLDHFKPDVALLDIGLPHMDGYALAARIRQRLGARTPRMIAITGYGQASDRAHSRARGFDLHLVKPVDPTDLLRLLREP